MTADVVDTPQMISSEILNSLSPFHRAVLEFTAEKYPHIIQIYDETQDEKDSDHEKEADDGGPYV